MTAVKITVDRDSCIGSGTCVQLAPGGFELDDDGVAEAVEPLAASEASLRTAERSCPVRAITVSILPEQ
jgi:ferredoxin